MIILSLKELKLIAKSRNKDYKNKSENDLIKILDDKTKNKPF